MPVSEIFQYRFMDLTDEMVEELKSTRAALIGISCTTFLNAYNNGTVPSLTSLLKIADYFSVSVDFLLGITENEKFVKSSNPATFAQRLTALREEKGVRSVYELSQRTGIQRNNFARWFKGGCPHVIDLPVLADFFGVSIDYLLGRTDYKN